MTGSAMWEFPIDGADQWEGFNHPGIEHFRGNVFGGLAREIIQNSLDARSASPVTVSFQLGDIATAEIPGVAQLKSVMQKCASEESNKGRKAEEFFKAALKLLASKSIRVLSVSELNTSGIRGPCKKGTPYYAYMKATGQSQKELYDGSTGLGSYGIGKFAPFATSNLRTIFVSTVFEEKGKFKQLTQGKAILTSHVDSKDRTHQNIGYWGEKESCTPVEGGHSTLPKWLQRSEKLAQIKNRRGTTLHIIGFNAVKGWEDLLIASVLENFFAAIWKGQLVVEVGKEIIAKGTIKKAFDRPGLVAALEGVKGEPEAFNHARQYLEVLTNIEEVQVEDQENREIGNCEVKILVGENLPKRVAVLRNGMFITDQMDHLKRFGDYKEFTAVVECLNAKGNELLRDMEPPRHDDFEPERLPLADQAKGQRALAELGRWVRDMLKRHAQDPVGEVSEVRELADYFADDSTESSSNGKGEEVNPLGSIEIRAQPLKRRALVIVERGSEDLGGGSGGGGGSGSGGDAGSGTSGKESAAQRTIELSNVRSVALSSRKRRVSFTPSFTGKFELVVYEAGADTDRRLMISRSSAGKAKQGLVRSISAKSGTRITIDLELSADFLGAMKVVGNAVR